MKLFCALLIVLLAPPVFADSISTLPPILQFSASGIESTINSYTLSSSVWGADTFTSSFYIGPGDPFGNICAALVSAGSLSASILTMTFNGDVVSGTFQGTENIWMPSHQHFAVWKYAVTGTFSELVKFNGQGTASINITDATFVGMTEVPEPWSILMFVTGLAGIVAKRIHAEQRST